MAEEQPSNMAEKPVGDQSADVQEVERNAHSEESGNGEESFHWRQLDKVVWPVCLVSCLGPLRERPSFD